MRRLKLVLASLIVLGILAYMGAPLAQADTVLLSGGGWTFYNTNTNAYKDFTVGGVSLRVNLESYASVTHSLSYDESAGFGVISASGNSILLDSGTSNEIIIVTFNRNVTLSGYGMSNWSTGNGLEPKVYKSGGAEIYLPKTGGSEEDGIRSFSFAGQTLLLSESVRFNSNGGSPNDDLRLARLDVNVDAAPVPIPGAVWLLGSGLVGLVAMRRRFRK